MPPNFVLAILALAIAGASAARAQTVESSVTVALTAKFNETGPLGDRILTVRIGTKDLIEGIREELGVQGRSYRLAQRRSIDDVSFDSVRDFLIVDGVYHDITDPVEPPPIEMPASF